MSIKNKINVLCIVNFINYRASFESTAKEIKITSDSDKNDALKDEEPSVWIFQGNPERYDILNALSDKEIGNYIHWTVNQHK